MLFIVIVGLLAIVWSLSGRRPRALHDFAALLESAEFVDDAEDMFLKRWSVRGQFRGRNIGILMHEKRKRFAPSLVVSMETRAHTAMETFHFAGYRADRDGELALFDLEVKDELRLRHEVGCLKALWTGSWHSLVGFRNRLNAEKWRTILERMDTLAASLERREAA